MEKKHLFWKEHFWRILITACGLFMILLTLGIGAFLAYKGVGTFTTYGHSVWEFFFSASWDPADNTEGGGTVGAAVYLVGSLSTCFLGLLLALPFSLAAAIFLSEIAPPWSEKFFRPAVELFVGIPSIIYGWMGLTILVPVIRDLFGLDHGFSVLAAGIVLAVMIFPTITTVAADALRAVPKDYRRAAYGLGATRWQVIWQVVLPAARPGVFTGIILGLCRAFGEAMAVAMVIGRARQFPDSILSPTTSLTTAIASDMGGAMDGGEYSTALWTMALVLFGLSLLFILLIHLVSRKGGKSHGRA